MDLGDPDSPYGNVHFQNKQEIAKRIVAAAIKVASKTYNTITPTLNITLEEIIQMGGVVFLHCISHPCARGTREHCQYLLDLFASCPSISC